MRIDDERNKVDIIKVAAQSRAPLVAGAIIGQLRECRYAYVQAVGASAVNQAVKAIIIARRYLQPDGLDLVCCPMFVTVEIEGRETTAVRIVVQVRSGNVASGD